MSNQMLTFTGVFLFITGFLGGLFLYHDLHTCEAEDTQPWSIEEIQRYAGVPEDGMLGPLTTERYRARREKELFNQYGIENYLGKDYYETENK